MITGCGDQTKKDDSSGNPKGNDTGKPAATSTSAAPLFAKLPQKYQDSGVIKVGTDASYAPMEQTENGKIVGIDPDLADALSQQLGVRFEFTNGKFDGLITSLYTGRSDVVMSAMSDTKARQEGLDDKGKKTGKGVDFVDYYTSGSSLLVKKGNPKGIKSLADLCGQTVAVQRGTIYQDAFKAQKTACGSKGLTIQPFDTDAEAQTRVKAGGAVADLNDTPVAAYIAQKSGNGNDFEIMRLPGRRGPLRHRAGQEQQPAAGRAQGGRGRDHRGRLLRQGAGEVERGDRCHQPGGRQRRFLTVPRRMKGGRRD